MIGFRRIGSEIVVLILAVLGQAGFPLLEAAGSAGDLNGRILDESGLPLPNILVSLSEINSEQALPLLTRTDEVGSIAISDIEPGTYQLSVKSGHYRGPEGKLVRILPGQTTAVTLVLQQLFHLEGSREENVGLKALFRNLGDRRLIFRSNPGAPLPGGLENQRESFIEEAVFEIHSDSGLGGGYLLFPRDSWGGPVSNFALVDTGFGDSRHVFAGQFRSSDRNSLFRLKSLVDYRLSDHHVVELTVGVGRIRFGQADQDLFSREAAAEQLQDLETGGGSVGTLTLGLQDRFEVGRWMKLSWGWEMNQVRSDQNHVFLSPNAEVEVSPLQGTSFHFILTSRRSTKANSLVTPGGRAVNLSDALQMSRIDDQLRFGTSRYLKGSFRQTVGEKTELEIAAFDDQISGMAVPVFAVLEFEPAAQAVHMDDDQARSSGYRVSLQRRLGDHLKAKISYLRGNATQLVSAREFLNFSQLSATDLLERKQFRAFSTEVESYIPNTRTHITALIKLVPGSNPISDIDSLSDVYDTSNQGVNVFVRQIIPVPTGFLSFLGLDFLAPEQVEAIIDVRNLMNEDLGTIHTAKGDAILVRSPRTVSGGLSFRF